MPDIHSAESSAWWRAQYLLVASVLFSAASLLGARGVLVFAAAGIGLAVLAVKGVGREISANEMLRVVSASLILGVIVSAASPLVGVPDATALDYSIWLGPGVVAAGWAFITSFRRREAFPPFLGAVALLGVLIAGVQVMLAYGGSGAGIDVYASHLAAADALAHGHNPYTAAATFFDGFPGSPPGSMLEGYVYPPVTLVGYSLATWLTGDPRWLNVVAWLAVLGVVMGKAWRSGDPRALGALLVLCANPGWRLVVFSAWTEPLTVALMVLAIVEWTRRPRLGIVLFGLALGSKQYMILLLPLLILFADAQDRRRMIRAQLVALASMIPFLVWNPDAFIHAVITRQLSQGFRSDSQSLAGALSGAGGQLLYVGAGLLAVIGMSFLLRRATVDGRLLMAAGIVLASFFAVAQGLVNYWFLVSALVALGAVLVGPPPAHDSDGRTVGPPATG